MKKIFIILSVVALSGCLTLTPRQEEIIVVAGSTILYSMTIGTAIYINEFQR